MERQRLTQTNIDEPSKTGFKTILLVLLISVVFISAIAVIYVKHQTRQYFAELQSHQQEADNQQVEWSQLLVEQGTWGSDARVERLAHQTLKMRLPDPKEVKVIKQ